MKDAVSLTSNLMSDFISTLTYFDNFNEAADLRADGYGFFFLRSCAKSSPAPQAAQKALTLNLF